MPTTAPLPLALVKNVGTNNSNSSAATTLAVTVPAAGCAMGNLVVVRFAGFSYTSGTVSIADSRSNTWHLDFAKTNGSDGINQVWSSWLTTALQSGDTITVTFPSANQNYAMGADEFTGIASSGQQLWTVDGTGTTGTSGTPSDTLSPGATTPAVLWYGALFVAAASGDSFTEDSTNTTGGAWASLAAALTATGANAQATRAAYKVPNTSLTSSQTWAPTMTSRGWIETLIVYSGGGTGEVYGRSTMATLRAATR